MGRFWPLTFFRKPRATFISIEELERRIDAAWDRRRTFAMTRLGDAENTVLQYPKFVTEERAQIVFSRVLEDRVYDQAEILNVRRKLIDATKASDLVGMYDSDHEFWMCAIFEEHLEYAGLKGLTTFYPSLHLALQCRGYLAKLLGNATRVTFICGRDVQARVLEHFPHLDLDQITVPTERSFRLAEDAARHPEPHYPDAFERVMARIAPEGPQHLFLVGAGFFGNIYCAEVKRRGGFALDIGSVFDYWAHVPTRETAETVKEGALVSDGATRFPGIYLGEKPEPEAMREKFPHLFRAMTLRSLPRS
jgi:hypothetical protein